MVLYGPNFSLMFLIHLFLYAGVYCNAFKSALLKLAFAFFMFHPYSQRLARERSDLRGAVCILVYSYLATKPSNHQRNRHQEVD